MTKLPHRRTVTGRRNVLAAAAIVSLAAACTLTGVSPANATLPHTTQAAIAVADSSISGNVRFTSAGLTVLNGNQVQLTDQSGMSEGAAVTTDALGNFTVSSVSPGIYKVNSRGTWWNGASEATAGLVRVSAGQSVAGINIVTSWRPTTISGSVKNAAGAAVASDYVTAYDPAGNYYTGALTDAAGHYTLSVGPGVFKIYADKTAGFAGQWLGGKGERSATTVTVAAGQNATAPAITLSPGATVSGIVTDATAQRVGLSNISVIATDLAGNAVWGAEGYTGTDGSYSMPGLLPGSYKIHFVASSFTGVNVASQWWGGATTAAAATTVTVTAGQTKILSVALTAGATISGTVKGAGVAPAGLLNDYVAITDSMGVDIDSTTTDSAGKYSFSALAAGSYTLKFSAVNAFAGQSWSSSVLGVPTTHVAVKAGQSVTGINTVLPVGGTISGAVTTTAGTGITGLGIGVWMLKGSSFVLQPQLSTTAANGQYTVPGLTAGSYKVEFNNYGFNGYASGASTFGFNKYASGGSPITPGSGQSYQDQFAANAPSLGTAKIIVIGGATTASGVNAALVRTSTLQNFTATPAPLLSGTGTPGSVLTARAGNWLPAATEYEYAWSSCQNRINGANAATYTVTPADWGCVILVSVTARKTGYASVTQVSESGVYIGS